MVPRLVLIQGLRTGRREPNAAFFTDSLHLHGLALRQAYKPLSGSNRLLARWTLPASVTCSSPLQSSRISCQFCLPEPTPWENRGPPRDLAAYGCQAFLSYVSCYLRTVPFQTPPSVYLSLTLGFIKDSHLSLTPARQTLGRVIESVRSFG